MRYLSILPTNHAIDFMVGFIGPFVCGACVVHLRTLRPEFVRDAFIRYRITYMALVPMVLKNLERGLKAKFDELSAFKRFMLNRMIGINKLLTRQRPNVEKSRKLLPQVHQAFGGELLALPPALRDHWEDVTASFHDQDAHHLYVHPDGLPRRSTGARRCGSRASPATSRTRSARRPPTPPRARCARPSPSWRSWCAPATARSSPGRAAARRSAPQLQPGPRAGRVPGRQARRPREPTVLFATRRAARGLLWRRR